MDGVSHVFKAPELVSKACAGPSCVKKGALLCSRCKRVWYCGKDCQLQAWKSGHRKICIEATTSQSSQLTPSIVGALGTLPTPTTNEGAAKAFMLKAINKLNDMGPDEAGDSQCDQCKSPAFCISIDKSGEAGIITGTARAMFMCKNKHMTVATDVCMGVEKECTCSINLVRIGLPRDLPSSYSLPATAKTLVVSGFSLIDARMVGRSGLEDSSAPAVDRLKRSFSAKGLPWDAMLADNGEAVTKQMLSGKFSRVILYGINDRGLEAHERMFQNGFFLAHLEGWLRSGGRLVLHGEGQLIGIIANIILKDEGKWHFCGDWYRRCKHSRNKAPEAVVDYTTLPRGYSMKATMLSGVLPRHQVYSPRPNTLSTSNIPGFGGHVVHTRLTAVAAAKVGSGLLAYIGDVNLEEQTIELFGRL